MKKLDTRSCEEIMMTVYKAIEFVVENLIAQGLYIFARAPKVGKSWLSLEIYLSIAKGEKVLEHETKCGTACIFALRIALSEYKNACMNLQTSRLKIR